MDYTYFTWKSQHWWSRNFELAGEDGVIATMKVRGGQATAHAFDRDYGLSFVYGFPCVITLQEKDTDNLLAQIDLMPIGGGCRVTFADGQQFMVGWAKWSARECIWTNDDGMVLTSKKTWSRRLLRVNPSVGRRTWILIALLQLALDELRRTRS